MSGEPVPQLKELTEAEKARVAALEEEISQIWSTKGNYKIDDEAWKSMPMFMEEITEEDVATNPACAAMSSILYDTMEPLEVAQKCKDNGNHNMKFALNPEQVNRENFARSAERQYTEGLQQKCDDRQLNTVLYTNRSIANFVLKNFGRGLEDAQKAIILNPSWHKAYFRGAKCSERVRKFDYAKKLIEKGLELVAEDPEANAGAIAEFKQLEKEVLAHEQVERKREVGNMVRAKAQAAERGGMVRDLKSKGINVGTRYEISMAQWGKLSGGSGNQSRPYYDTDGNLHVPLLFLYDEYNQTDFMCDVMAADVQMYEALEELMPFPWDDTGRYADIKNLVCVYIVDDGVAMPQYYVADMMFSIQEILQEKTYLMPGLLPSFHILPKGSEILKQWKIE